MMTHGLLGYWPAEVTALQKYQTALHFEHDFCDQTILSSVRVELHLLWGDIHAGPNGVVV